MSGAGGIPEGVALLAQHSVEFLDADGLAVELCHDLGGASVDGAGGPHCTDHLSPSFRDPRCVWFDRTDGSVGVYGAAADQAAEQAFLHAEHTYPVHRISKFVVFDAGDLAAVRHDRV